MGQFGLPLILLLLSAVSQFYGQVVRLGTCPNVDPVPNFNIHKMEGEWYLQSLYHYCPQSYVRCSVYNMTVTETKINLTMGFQERFYDEFSDVLRVRDTIKIIDPLKPSLSISEVHTPCFRDLQVCSYVAVGPKYEYFVTYCCKPFKTKFKYETMGVRTRARFPSEDLQKQINMVIEKLGLSTEFLYPVDQTSCDLKHGDKGYPAPATPPAESRPPPACATNDIKHG